MNEDYNEKYREMLGIDLGLTEEENRRINSIKRGPRDGVKPKALDVNIQQLSLPMRRSGIETVNWEFYLRKVREEWCFGEWDN